MAELPIGRPGPELYFRNELRLDPFRKVACDVPGWPATGKGGLAHLERVELLPNVAGGAVREASPGPPDVSELATAIFAENQGAD